MPRVKKANLDSIASVVAAAGTMRRVYRESRCPCGCGGSWDRTVSGTIGGEPAIWMGCERRGGSAVGGGLTGDDYHVAIAVLSACESMGISAQDAVESECVREQCVSYVTGPLALDAEREALQSAFDRWERCRWGNTHPDDWLAKREYGFRGMDIDDVCDGIWTRQTV